MSSVREATEREYIWLLERARQSLPYSRTVVGTLEVIVHLDVPKVPATKVWIPSDPENLPFFIAITNSEDFQSILLYWDKGSFEQFMLVHLLSSIPRINWKNFVRFCSVDVHVLSEIEELVASEVLAGSSLERKISQRGNVLNCVPENFPQTKLPIRCELRSLTPEHAKFVEDHWEYSKKNPMGYLDFAIANLGSSAIFTDDPEEDGQPVSWAILRLDSQIGVTYTNPKFRGKKLASIVTIDLCKKMLEKGFHPYVLVPVENTVSTKMHEKLGLQKTSKVGWDYYVPVDGSGIPGVLKYLF